MCPANGSPAGRGSPQARQAHIGTNKFGESGCAVLKVSLRSPARRMIPKTFGSADLPSPFLSAHVLVGCTSRVQLQDAHVISKRAQQLLFPIRFHVELSPKLLYRRADVVQNWSLHCPRLLMHAIRFHVRANRSSFRRSCARKVSGMSEALALSRMLARLWLSMSGAIPHAMMFWAQRPCRC